MFKITRSFLSFLSEGRVLVKAGRTSPPQYINQNELDLQHQLISTDKTNSFNMKMVSEKILFEDNAKRI